MSRINTSRSQMERERNGSVTVMPILVGLSDFNAGFEHCQHASSHHALHRVRASVYTTTQAWFVFASSRP